MVGWPCKIAVGLRNGSRSWPSNPRISQGDIHSLKCIFLPKSSPKIFAEVPTVHFTAATYKHPTQFKEEDRDFLADELVSVAAQTGIELCGWTTLPDHYHFIATIAEGRSLAKFAGHFHARTSRLINRQRGTEGQSVWRQYWDTLLRSDGDYWSRMNYMWWNPVRHGHVEKPEDWRWTNLHAVMMDDAPEMVAVRQKFPAPRRLPNDEF